MAASSSTILASDVVSTFFGKRAWPGCPSKKQDWGYPESMIHYIAKNPSSAEVYQKMIQSCNKIWLRDELDIEDGAKNFTSVLCSKLYQCEVYRLRIWDKVITFDDFKLLTSSAKEITLCGNKIAFNDGKPVMLDKILESSPIVNRFSFNFENDGVSMVNVSTMKNIMKLKNLGKIEFFGLYNLPESLSVEDISAFFK
uniref:Uncharacterized protein n=1 Tax=Panagrolaimus sp. PS1159 TaxID=55785 RepID=A0AC35GMM0_9BILA